MRNQVELTLTIGLPDRSLLDAFGSSVIRGATAYCGGCTVSIEDGYWRTDGTDKKTYFTGSQEAEVAMVIKLTCETHKEDMVMRAMRTHIANLVFFYKIDVDWVHVVRKEVQGLHFSCKENLRKTSVNEPLEDKWPADPKCPVPEVMPALHENLYAYNALADAASPRDASHHSFMKYAAALARVKRALGLGD